MPDTSPASVRIRELTAQYNAMIDATEQLHADIEQAFDVYHERIALAGALKRERAGDKVSNNGRQRK